MANLVLLWWAGDETGASKYHEVARLHSERTLELLVRADDSTFQVVDFDPGNGEILCCGTIHGQHDKSTWARGQAWGVYGFARACQAMQLHSFSRAAELLSCYFFERLPADGRAYWDLEDPAIPHYVRDTSATAIAATAYLTMGGRWSAIGYRLIEKLATSSLTSNDASGIFSYVTAYKKQGCGLHQASTWGDYFFMKGLTWDKANSICVL
jgi:unsaturated chondroitin disaccharide hydrolase